MLVVVRFGISAKARRRVHLSGASGINPQALPGPEPSVRARSMVGRSTCTVTQPSGQHWPVP
eukprot:13482623-Alexandrium_andersonii.AAC.1